MSLVFDGFEIPYIYRWPLGPEEYEGAIKFKADVGGRTIPVIIAFDEKEVFGALRRKVYVIVKDRVMLELTGADDYERTGLLVGVLKKPGSEEHYRPDEPIPLEFSRFTIVIHKHYIHNGFNSLAVLFNIADIKGMADYGLLRAKLEGVI